MQYSAVLSIHFLLTFTMVELYKILNSKVRKVGSINCNVEIIDFEIYTVTRKYFKRLISRNARISDFTLIMLKKNVLMYVYMI